MKYLILILAVFVAIPAFAQDDFPVKTDGTKYYMQVYDGETNQKVVYYNAAGPAWNTLIHVADFFDGSPTQLWSFEANPNFPGYFIVRNRAESLFATHSLMSWSWNAYMATDASRPPENEKEKHFRFVEAFDGYYILETIEKPTDGSLYGINYTEGADAMNVQDGIVSFRGVKSADITRDNMANKVFKIVEFNPLALFEESIVRGDKLYNENPDLPASIRFDLFYNLEKGREARVFASEAEILAYQPVIDSVLNQFKSAVNFKATINDARNFIDTVGAGSDIVSSFNTLVDGAEAFISSDDFEYSEIDSVLSGIDDAMGLVSAIIASETYKATLTEADSLLSNGMTVAINSAKGVIDNSVLGSEAFASAIDVMTQTEAIIEEVKYANDTIAGTLEFDEAKSELNAAIEKVIATINTTGTTVAQLDQALLDIKNATKTFIKSLEGGDTPVEVKNYDFTDGLDNWDIESPTPDRAYPENKGVDGSRSITFWSGAEYQMKVSQSISNIPNGTYQISCFAKVNLDGVIALFGESASDSDTIPFVGNQLSKHVIEVDVTDGTLVYGVRGYSDDNTIPAGRWVVFDEFEVKWKSSLPVANAEFADALTDWLVEGVTAAAYPENKGVDGSRSITCWRGSEYDISVSQTFTGLVNGYYTVSGMAKTNKDSAFVIFAESADTIGLAYVTGNTLSKFKAVVEVSDGTLKFGAKGAGEGNLVPAGRWIVFDNIEVVKTPNVPVVNSDISEDLAGWLVEGVTAAAYPENKGVDGSRSITFWRGSDYDISVSQSVIGLINGTYEISVMAKTKASSGDLFALYGASAGVEAVQTIAASADLQKTKVQAIVTDGGLEFGVRGSGVDNAVPKTNWIVWDNVEVKVISITPDYLVQPQAFVATALSAADKDMSIKIWSVNKNLNVLASKNIDNYTVYSITGSVVEKGRTNSPSLTIPLQKGIYFINVTMIDGETKVSKVLIR